MHQIMIAVFVLLWLITAIHVAAGTCIACAISGMPASSNHSLCRTANDSRTVLVASFVMHGAKLNRVTFTTV